MYVCQTFYCDRPIDLKGNEATKFYCECFRMSLFVYYYVPNFFLFYPIRGKDQHSVGWEGRGGEGDDKEL